MTRIFDGIAEERAASHFGEMSSTFRSKAHEFAEQVLSDVKLKQQTPEVASRAADETESERQEPPVPPTINEPQAYHEESRASEFGAFMKIVA